MKILIISNIFPPGSIGGYEIRAFETAQALQEKGNDIRVLTSDYFLDDENTIKNFTVDRILEYVASQHCYTEHEALEKGQFINVRNLRLFNKIFNEFKPDVVVCFNLFGLGVLGILHHLVNLNIKPVVSLGDNIFQALYANADLLKKYLSIFGSFNFLQKVTYQIISRVLACEIENLLGFSFKNLHIIPGWSKHSGDEKITINLTPGDSIKKIRFVFASRLANHKGIYILIEAIHHLVTSGESNFIVDLYGAGETSLVMQKIAIKGLSSFIQYRGILEKNQVHKTFHHYDALLFPTWEREPFGLVSMEAAVSGCIPIITSTIGAAEWFIHNYDCIKINRDYLSLSSAIKFFLRMSKQDKKLLKSQAINTALTYLNFENLFNSFYQLIIDNVEQFQQESLRNNKRCEMAMYILENIWRKT